ncbi:phosphoinositide phosphatase SAC2 isoform X3 [Daucus carota subsp. sativus]|nr:PREDICTED: phosphoinositide phosphatase SAC2-like isoform X1 [Daucus carota subsp. sativus]
MLAERTGRINIFVWTASPELCVQTQHSSIILSIPTGSDLLGRSRMLLSKSESGEDSNMSPEMQQTFHLKHLNHKSFYLQKFRLYETRSNFYMIGQDKSGSVQRVLKINRLELSELNIIEDCTTYSEVECCELLKRINDGNKSTGGLKFVTVCYGIVGFVKFLGPYYMLLITRRRKIGVICGHAIYAVTKSKMITIPNSAVQSNMAYSKNENRYKKLLCTVDLTKDFFFSYSYHIMRSLQKNMSNHESGHVLYETMFVWNEFMTRGIRNHLKNTLWTVALVYGFFKQLKLQMSGKDFNLTLIARRSRHYAGTRYLKRGVNEKGRVANDVETEQIVIEDVPGRCTQISSVVQHRGSIPLFWSQETSRLNIKPDIILSKKDPKYEATRLHFENLSKRYGNPIIILNLIKTREKRPRESILRTEFRNAIDLINKDLPEENRLKFLHLDLNKISRSRTTNVLGLLAKMAAYALNLTDFFYCQVKPCSRIRDVYNSSSLDDVDDCKACCNSKGVVCIDTDDVGGSTFIRPSFQKGILRTNCIDCLDRTNVAQYAYGLVAFGWQLHALGLQDTPNIDLDFPLADDLMRVYEMMGDTLAMQYGGSAAHNKIFCQRRGQWKAATQSQEFLRTLQRYYSNAYMDAEKQDAINVFLGHFQPHQGKPELWELDSDQHHNVGNRGSDFSEESARSTFKRSLSDGNISGESNSAIANTNVNKLETNKQMYPNMIQGSSKVQSDSTPEILSCESEASYATRFTPGMSGRQLFSGSHSEQFLKCDSKMGLGEHWDSFNYSNFLDSDWHSSSGNSCEEELYERSSLITSPDAGLSSESIVNKLEVGTNTSESGSIMHGKGMIPTDLDNDDAHSSNILTEFSDTFVNLLQRCCSF